MKKPLLYIIGFVLFFGGMIWWSKSLQENNPDIVSRGGIHWHPNISIYAQGEKQEVSANIGIGPGGMGSIHTHDTSGELHVEAAGLVRKDDIKVKQFFRAWGKEMNSFGQNVVMTINGVENTELGEYVMQDKDKIELRYE